MVYVYEYVMLAKLYVVIICGLMQFMLASYRLKKNDILVLEPCCPEDTEDDEEEGDDPLLDDDEVRGRPPCQGSVTRTDTAAPPQNMSPKATPHFVASAARIDPTTNLMWESLLDNDEYDDSHLISQ